MSYDKTEMNAFVQSLYDQKMQEGKHGHYETMFHVVHKAIERAAQSAQPVALQEQHTKPVVSQNQADVRYKITVLTNEHPNGIPYEEWAQPVAQPAQRTGNCLLTRVCASEGHQIQPKAQGKPICWADVDPIDGEVRGVSMFECPPTYTVPLYKSVTVAQPLPLTDEQVERLRGEANRGYCIEKEEYFKAFRDAEAAHGIKA